MGSRLEKNSNNVRKRIAEHTFDGEDGEEYSASKFGGFSDYMRRKKLKLQNLDAQLRSESDKPPIFRNIVVWVNGYTQPSLADLHVLIVSHGGGFQQYLDGKTTVTHIIASQLTPKKKAEFAKYRIVKPAWVVDSVQAGRVLPWEQYRVLDEGVTQKVLGFERGSMVSQSSAIKSGYRDQTDTSWYTSQVRDAANQLNAAPNPGTGFRSTQSFDQMINDEDLLNAEIDQRAENLARGPSSTPPVPDVSQGHHVPDILPLAMGSRDTSDHTVVQPENRQLTAEEHNAILLQNPHMAKSSTANPDFIQQYYRESRLHHLSMWKADLKAQLQARAQQSSQRRLKQKRPSATRRYIMHVDFDSFFAAVSLRKNPQLKDKAVVVAHGSGPGSEIASCNYPAREFGVKNGMWMKTALELCPNLKVLPYDYQAYEEASKHFYDAILAVDGLVQSISIDEALVDITDLCIRAGGSDGKLVSESSLELEQAKANEIAQHLRATVREKTGCDVSVGIGGNILLAKVALRKAKPAGQHLIKPENVLDFVGELTVTDLPGVASSIGKKLEEIGVSRVKDVRDLTKEKLINALGPKTGEKIWDYSRGIDKQEVGEQVIRKSVSAEVNWGIRFINQQQAEEFIYSLCEELSKRLLEQLVKGRQLTMKVMRKAADAGMDPPKNLGHGKCDTFNKSVILGVATNDKILLGKEAVAILRGYGFPPGELRGLGVQMQKLEPMKPATSGETLTVDSSQRRLQFKKPEIVTRLTEQQPSSPSPVFKNPPMSSQRHGFGYRSSVNIEKTMDPIEEAMSPTKPDSLAARNQLTSLEDDHFAPLNLAGTQFLLPSQIDPSVLAELPADIRARLAPKASNLLAAVQRADIPKHDIRSRSGSPFLGALESALPRESQIDPEILAALPDDVRNEILSEYKNASHAGAIRKEQQLLPQSPRKARPSASKKLNVTPKKKNKFSTLLSKSKMKKNILSGGGLVQSNFLSLKDSVKNAPAAALIGAEEISADVLAELPDDIRNEILAEQKRQRLQQKSGLSMMRRKRPKLRELSNRPTKLNLPQPPPRPVFTSKRLSTITELRDAMSSWVQVFSSEDEDGPYHEDTESLGVYLRRVVYDENDMAKACAVIEWLIYVLGDWPFDRDSLRVAWQDTVAFLKSEVQEAVQARGIAPLQFSE